ncbi:MAG: glycine cleavage system aminomethyltransferase GcvT, partial [Chloroflexota bacterium]
VKHGAKMVPFAGWEMPLQYASGAKSEHHATRNAAGLFDIDHMGQFALSGPDADAYLNNLVTWDIGNIQENEAHYALLCYEDGTIIDDIYVYRLPQRWFIAVNAANRAKDFAWMQAHTAGYDVELIDVSDETYMLALQGPKALRILQALTDIDVSGIPRFHLAEAAVDGFSSLISRTGYTGEDGVELFFAERNAVDLWQTLLEAGAEHGLQAIGLAARDSLRFEPGFALYGHEIDATITPLEARLSWVINFEADFIGRNALLKQKLEGGPSRRLVGFEMVDKGVPREGYGVHVQDEAVGTVVSGLYAPTLDKFVGHTFLPRPFTKLGTEIQINIRDKFKTAKVVRRPMYKPTYRD